MIAPMKFNMSEPRQSELGSVFGFQLGDEAEGLHQVFVVHAGEHLVDLLALHHAERVVGVVHQLVHEVLGFHEGATREGVSHRLDHGDLVAAVGSEEGHSLLAEFRVVSVDDGELDECGHDCLLFCFE